MQITVYPEVDHFYRIAQDEAVIASVGQELRFSGMGPCSALILRNKERQLGMHVDAGLDAVELRTLIHEYFDLQDPSLGRKVVLGASDDSYSSTGRKILSVLKLLGIARDCDFSLRHILGQDLIIGKDGSVFHADREFARDEIIVRGTKEFHHSFSADFAAIRTLENGIIQQEFSTPTHTYFCLYKSALVGPSKGNIKGKIGVYLERGKQGPQEWMRVPIHYSL